MERYALSDWIVGAVVLGLLVAFHWFAFRVQKSRRGRIRPPRRDGVPDAGLGTDLTSNDPFTPK